MARFMAARTTSDENNALRTASVGKRWRREAEVLAHDLIGLVAYPEAANLMAASRRARTLSEHVEVQKRLAKASLDARSLDQTIKRELAHVNANCEPRRRHNACRRAQQDYR
jgi:hypothetical protein